MTNEKLLTVILILFVVGAISYFTFSRFKEDVSTAKASPSPTPQNLNFNFNATPTPAPAATPAPGQQSNQQATAAPQPTELPLARNKRLSQFPGMVSSVDLQNKKAVIQTKKGLIELEVYPEASMAASNFLILAANGFYDGLTFHRVEPGFVIQGGDPSGNGTGGPGYSFPDEPVTRDYTKGIVAYANSGPDTNGSQFFIMLEDNSSLPKQYTIFGQVISGMDVVSKIAVGDVMQKVVIQPLK